MTMKWKMKNVLFDHKYMYVHNISRPISFSQQGFINETGALIWNVNLFKVY